MADVAVPGARAVRASLDTEGAESIVVACPPHPQQRGHRGDPRLTAVGEALAERGVACLRFDYGEWDEGYGELADARNALSWARDEYDRVGLFGFSFGGCVALLAAAEAGPDLRAVSALAPASRLQPDLDAAAVLDEVECPVQVVYGERDDTADWRLLVETARDRGMTVDSLPADHFFIGQTQTVAMTVTDFLAPALGDA